MRRDLLQQWGTQINIPAIPGTASKEIRGDMVDASGEGISAGDREQTQLCPWSKTRTSQGLSF